MKHIYYLVVGLSLLFFCKTGFCNGSQDNQTGILPNTAVGNTLNINSSPELFPLASSWAVEYGKLNPTMKIVVNKIADNQSLADKNLRFVSNVSSETVNDESGWKMVIGRDAIVPVINSKNPMLTEINREGFSAGKIANLFVGTEKLNWETMISGGQSKPINCYVIDNSAVRSGVAEYTKTNPATLNGIMVASAEELISVVQKDVYAIGFCKLIDVRKANANELVENIKLLPIDKNGNGRLDNFENIYDNLDTFTRGVWIGKYPSALCGSIYAMSTSKPTDKNALAFLTWILTDGAQLLNSNGYSDLASFETKSNLDALIGKPINVNPTQNPSVSNPFLIVLAVILIVALIITLVVRRRNQKSSTTESDIHLVPVLNEDMLAAPKGLYFDKTHTWAFMEKDGMVKVGIDDFLQHITGTITRIKMKETGEKVRKGEPILTLIQDGKQLNIYAPISGIIRQQNQILAANASAINASPYSHGWVYLIEPKNWVREIQFLFMGEKYKDWLNNEFTRLKDFFAATVKTNTLVYAHIVLQDGGELTDNVLADLGPEVWEDFQTHFIDTSK